MNIILFVECFSLISTLSDLHKKLWSMKLSTQIKLAQEFVFSIALILSHNLFLK